ncbi:hypothetical protein D1BOALGB6SA_991 [Olavius sp. associated proteobacterium Delta 1]|nr:hypothetical protein D1BOALGB6SA_991 [Olavius sp. associated proteobacterium Delta 1]
MKSHNLYGLKNEGLLKFWKKEPLPQLSAALKEARVKVVDVGARGGAIKELIRFAPFIHYVAIEPEQKARNQLKFEAPWQNVTTVPYALGLAEGKHTLHVTKQPGMSSLLSPNPSVVERYPSADAFQVVDRQEVDLMTLDKAADQFGFRDTCFLKLDTQGTELDILKSGHRMLKNFLIGIAVEVSFQEFYQSQPLFSEVDKFLRDNGFRIFELDRALSRRRNLSATLFSKREIIWAHALYLREPAEIIDSSYNQGNCSTESRHNNWHKDNPEANGCKTKLLQLLLLALAYEYIDFSQEIIRVMIQAKMVTAEAGEQLLLEVQSYARRRTFKVWLKLKKFPGKGKTFDIVHKDRKLRFRIK